MKITKGSKNIFKDIGCKNPEKLLKEAEIKSASDVKKLFKRTLLDEIIYYCFYIWWNKLEMLPLRIKSFIQRGRRGWADADTWDFDGYLIDVIGEGLRHLKVYQNGCPTEIYDKYKNLSIEESDKATQKEWHEILDKIIEGFDAAKVYIEYFCELTEEERLECEKIRKEGFDLFKEYFFSLWD